MPDKQIDIIDIDSEQTTDLVPVVEERGLTTTTTIAVAKDNMATLQVFVSEYLVQGEDYGRVPGIPKPFLWQSGAQKLLDVYGLSAQYNIIPDVDRAETPTILSYFSSCTLTRRSDGMKMGQGVGEANSRENKYWSWVNGAKTPDPNPYDKKNTIAKMAKKRSLVDATLSVTRSSGLFTQDPEAVEPNPVKPNPVKKTPVPDPVRAIDPAPEKARTDNDLPSLRDFPCPSCGEKAIIASKPEFGGGWLCFKKKQGCGKKWGPDDDPRIEELGDPTNTDEWKAAVRQLEQAVANHLSFDKQVELSEWLTGGPTLDQVQERTKKMAQWIDRKKSEARDGENNVQSNEVF